MIEEVFNEDTILKYSEVCVDLAVDMPEKASLSSRNFDTLVIPSRGAVPFFLGMLYSLEKISTAVGGVHEEFYRNLGIQKMMSSLLPPNLRDQKEKNEKKSIQTLLIPFTADLNVSPSESGVSNEELTLKTRRYWADVTKSFFRQPSERSKDPYFTSFVDFILRDVEGRHELAEAYERFPQIGKFSMMDTVISGRASTEILSAFEGLSVKYENPNLNPSAFLIVDENGEKLKPYYSRYLSRRRLEGILDMYRVPRIVSEDEGASLLGVGAVIYPTIMKLSREFTINGEEFFIGAGAWHNSAGLKSNYFDNFEAFMDMIYSGIDFIYSTKYVGKEGLEEKELFDQERNIFLKRAKDYKIFKETREDISLLRPSSNYSYGSCHETSSHVLHAPFDKSSEERARSKIASLPGVKNRGNGYEKPLLYSTGRKPIRYG